jgi:hypothetical protein
VTYGYPDQIRRLEHQRETGKQVATERRPERRTIPAPIAGLPDAEEQSLADDGAYEEDRAKEEDARVPDEPTVRSVRPGC